MHNVHTDIYVCACVCMNYKEICSPSNELYDLKGYRNTTKQIVRSSSTIGIQQSNC